MKAFLAGGQSSAKAAYALDGLKSVIQRCVAATLGRILKFLAGNGKTNPTQVL